MEWSNFQTDIFDATQADKSNLMIQACAGSGKTTVLVEIAKRCQGNILFLAFNKSIQEELKARLGNSADCKTFHSYGLSLLKQEIGWYPKVDTSKVYDAVRLHFPFEKGEWSPRKLVNRVLKKMRGLGFMSYDEEDIQDFLRENSFCYNYNPREKAVEEKWALQNIHQFQFLLRELDELPIKQESDPADGKDRYPKYKTVIDFDDMVRYPCLYNIAARKKIWINTALVDEVQDTSPYQFHLLNQLYGRKVRIIVVGDRLQAIYAFRGSYTDSMDRVKDHIKANELPLSVTYRCKSNIVDFTNEKIDGSEMIPHKEGGEIEYIGKGQFVERVKEHNVPMIIGAKNKNLVRAWLELAKYKIASTLKDKGITMEIRRVLEDYNVVPTKDNKRTISIPKFVEELNDTIHNSTSVNEEGETVQNLPTSTLDIYDCIKQIIEIHGIERYTEFLNLLDEMDQDSDHELHTVHSAKGLEAESVIVLCDWFDNEQIRNMQYVAYTRAEDRLMLVTDWEKEDNIPGVTLQQIEEEVLERQSELEEESYDVDVDLEAPF